jgi:hypothetical protein
MTSFQMTWAEMKGSLAQRISLKTSKLEKILNIEIIFYAQTIKIGL